MNDPQSSTPHSPAGQGYRLGPGTGPRVGTLNYAHAIPHGDR